MIRVECKHCTWLEEYTEIVDCSEIACPICKTNDLRFIYIENCLVNKPLSKCMKCEPFAVNEECENRHTICQYPSKNKIADTCDNLKAFLLEKNRRYGNSVSEPVKIFNKNTNENSFFTRIDDKLSRIKNSTELRKNDVTDLAGYLILLCVEKGWTDFKELID